MIGVGVGGVEESGANEGKGEAGIGEALHNVSVCGHAQQNKKSGNK